MRDLRARVAAEHGVNLSNTQIEELAARRLDAILAPSTADATLIEVLKKSAGTAGAQVPYPAAIQTYAFSAATLYETKGVFVRFMRRLFRPFLHLLFNPDAIATAFETQTRINAALAAREQQRDTRQAEWNALHFEIVKRVVTETAGATIDAKQLAAQIESLSAKVDFNERRVLGIEGSVVVQARTPQPQAVGRIAQADADATTADGANGPKRRRRRRRRLNGESGIEVAPANDVSPAAERREPTTAPALGADVAAVAATAHESDAQAPAETTGPEPTREVTPTTSQMPEPTVESSSDASALEPSPSAAPEPSSNAPPEPSRWQQVFSPSGEDPSHS